MLDEKRIKEAEANIKRYLEEDLIKKYPNETAKQMYLKNSENSLQTAEKLLSLESKEYKPYLWIIVAAYYSMYYIANSVLLNLGYKVGDKISHKVTADALIVFIRNKLKKELLEEYEETKEEALEITSSRVNVLLKSYDLELGKRSRFQYQMEGDRYR